jgi:aminoglycoside phosphotransferase (APT) family kinase protein
MDAMSTSPEENDALAANLRDYLSAQQGRRVEAGALTRLSNGWESDVYAFDTPQLLDGGHDRGEAARASGPGRYILRLYFGEEAADKARHEGRAYALLARAGYPVPRVICAEPSTVALGRAFLIMARIDGEPLGHRWRDPDPAVQQREMTRFCELFAALHTLAWQHLPGAEHVPTFTIAAQIDYWESLINALRVTGFEAGLAWLRMRSATISPQPLGLAHWDFHHENILMDDDDHAWVIDWTQFQATDVRFDLAWTLVLLASERDVEIAQRVREGYFAVRGWRATDVAEELAFFEGAACLKRIVSVVVSLQRGADALGMRPGAEAIMTRGLPRIALVYKRWLALTATPMPVVDEMLAAHL